MRVAYLVNQYPAVSHTFIRREIEALERLGMSVTRIALRGWDIPLIDEGDIAERQRTRYVLKGGAGALAWALIRASFRVPGRLVAACRAAWQMSRDSERSLFVHLVYVAEACIIANWLDDEGVLHLHAHFATNPAEVAMLTHIVGGKPYSFTAHGSDIMDRPAQVGLQHTVSRAAFAVAVCSYGRGQIFKWLPHCLWGRVHVVRCGLQPGYGSEVPTAGAVRRLVCVGRLSKEKGQLLLVEAAAKVALSSNEPFEVVLVGDGPMRDQIQLLVSRYGIENRVRITGWLDAAGVQRELMAATALVVPSLSEGLPVVIMEAMASRRPVIAPYLAGIPELVRHSETGWLYPASDADRLAEVMSLCLNLSNAELREMGEAACRDVWSMHDVDIEVGKLRELMFAPAIDTNRADRAESSR